MVRRVRGMIARGMIACTMNARTMIARTMIARPMAKRRCLREFLAGLRRRLWGVRRTRRPAT
jgi:hypothetical protein